MQQLELKGVRNLQPQRLLFHRGINLFCGENGSGKTSLLEAIHLLGYGKSFRVANVGHLIKREEEKYSVGGVVVKRCQEGEIKTHLGSEKGRNSEKIFRVDGKASNAAAVAKLLPIQVVSADSARLVEDGPEYRRKFLDWALFHMEQEFWLAWQGFNRSILQRNAVLRQRLGRTRSLPFLQAWQEGLLVAAKHLDLSRRKLVQELEPVLQKTLLRWLPGKQIELRYQSGWEEGVDYAAVLRDNLDKDLYVGFTSDGPHRAEMLMLINGVPAKVFLSRGQQKLLVCALLLTRSALLKTQAKMKSVFLVDDLPAELDMYSVGKMMQGLVDLDSQVFVTHVEAGVLLQSIQALTTGFNLFRVIKGEIVVES